MRQERRKMDPIVAALERIMKPPKVRSSHQYIEVHWLFEPLSTEFCDICHHLCRDNELLSEKATTLILQKVPDLEALRYHETNRICKGCLSRYVRISVKVQQYDRLTHRYRTILQKTYPFSMEELKRLTKLKEQKPSALQIRLKPNKREIQAEIKRRRYRYLRQLESWDRLNRLYEGYERQGQRGTKMKKSYVPKPTLQDVIDVIEGRAVPREPIDCSECTRAVCPVDCPRRALIERLMIFYQRKRVDVDEWDLSQYEDFP